MRQHYLLRLTLYAVLTLYALWCSYSRVSDHQHHVTDVLAGGVLGGLVAVVTVSCNPLIHPPNHLPTFTPTLYINSSMNPASQLPSHIFIKMVIQQSTRSSINPVQACPPTYTSGD